MKFTTHSPRSCGGEDAGLQIKSKVFCAANEVVRIFLAIIVVNQVISTVFLPIVVISKFETS